MLVKCYETLNLYIMFFLYNTDLISLLLGMYTIKNTINVGFYTSFLSRIFVSWVLNNISHKVYYVAIIK